MPSRGSIAIKKASLFVSSQSPPDNRDDGDSFASPPSIYHFSIFFEEIERRGEGRGWSGAKPINFPRQRRIKRPILLPGEEEGSPRERNLRERQFHGPFHGRPSLIFHPLSRRRTTRIARLAPPRIVKTAPPTSRGSRARVT